MLTPSPLPHPRSHHFLAVVFSLSLSRIVILLHITTPPRTCLSASIASRCVRERRNRSESSRFTVLSFLTAGEAPLTASVSVSIGDSGSNLKSEAAPGMPHFAACCPPPILARDGGAPGPERGGSRFQGNLQKRVGQILESWSSLRLFDRGVVVRSKLVLVIYAALCCK